MNYSEKYCKLLELRNVTNYQVSKATNIPQSTLGKFKNNKLTPKLDKLKILASYFEVPIAYFITDEPIADKPLTREQILIQKFNALTNRQKQMAEKYIEFIISCKDEDNQ